MRKLLVILLVATCLITTSCERPDKKFGSNFGNNFNKFQKDVNQSQKELLVYQDIIVDSFYHKNNIRLDQTYSMPDSRYLVLYYHDTGFEPFEDIITKYREDAQSYNVYVAEAPDENVRLEFILKDKEVYTVEDVWYTPEDVDKLPYKLER